MNFDNAKFDVGNVYQDDPDKLHSDLIGINAIALEAEETANEAESPNLVIQDASLKVCFLIWIFFQKFDFCKQSGGENASVKVAVCVENFEVCKTILLGKKRFKNSSRHGKNNGFQIILCKTSLTSCHQ